jgi:IMP dehydrogenase
MEPQKIARLTPSSHLLPLALTFDDVLLLPSYSDFSRDEIDLSTNFSRNIRISTPLVSAPMDTVTESKLAISLARHGGIGIIHRNLTIEKQASEVKKVRNKKFIVGAAVGSGTNYKHRVKALASAGANAIVVDSAHGYSKNIIEATSYIKKNYPKIDVVSGNIATSEGAKALIKAGADGLRLGMGPGAICTTRVISGMGVPQVSAIFNVSKIARRANVPVVADGGIKFSGDMVKALAAGASSVMMGSFFASTIESPGDVFILKKEQVPQRFLSIFDKGTVKFYFKEYRGMGSTGAMKRGAKIKSENEFHGKSYKDRVLIAEGVEGLVPVKGNVEDLISQAVGGIKSGMYYVGAKKISDLWKANFVQITQASLQESHPHSILITNSGKNY